MRIAIHSLYFSVSRALSGTFALKWGQSLIGNFAWSAASGPIIQAALRGNPNFQYALVETYILDSNGNVLDPITPISSVSAMQWLILLVPNLGNFP